MDEIRNEILLHPGRLCS